MSEINVLENSDNFIVSQDSKNELRQVTAALLATDRDALANYSVMKLPIASLTTLGTAGASLLPSVRTITQTTKVDMGGLYTLVNALPGDALKFCKKDGTSWGAIKTAEGKSKMAKLKEADSITTNTTTVMPIDPTMAMMAVTMYSIEQKLDAIEEMQRQIMDFLHQENESEIEADVQLLSSIIMKYKHNWNNIRYAESNHKIALDIQRTALKNMRIYQKEIQSRLSQSKIIVVQDLLEDERKKFQKMFKYYRMALYTYSLASLIEILLSENFDQSYIADVKNTINGFVKDYRYFFDEASNHIDRLGDKSIDSLALKTFGHISCGAGKLIDKIPKIRDGLVDELLESEGEYLIEQVSAMKTEPIREFAKLHNPNVGVLTDRMEDLIQIYNHTERICIDKDNIYLVG